MQIVTSWMEKGIQLGEQKVIKMLLKQRFPHINESVESRINDLFSEQIEKLACIVFKLQSLEDFIKWLNVQD